MADHIERAAKKVIRWLDKNWSEYEDGPGSQLDARLEAISDCCGDTGITEDFIGEIFDDWWQEQPPVDNSLQRAAEKLGHAYHTWHFEATVQPHYGDALKLRVQELRAAYEKYLNVLFPEGWGANAPRKAE